MGTLTASGDLQAMPHSNMAFYQSASHICACHTLSMRCCIAPCLSRQLQGTVVTHCCGLAGGFFTPASGVAQGTSPAALSDTALQHWLPDEYSLAEPPPTDPAESPDYSHGAGLPPSNCKLLADLACIWLNELGIAFTRA